jgi:hypothetical protein
MKKTLILAVLIITVAAASPVMAFTKGTIRLGTGSGFSSATLDFDNGGSLDTDLLAIDVGYFLTDDVEIAFEYADESIDDLDFNVMGIAGKYYIPMDTNFFYVGGGYQNLDYDTVDGSAIYVTGAYDLMLRDYFSIDFYLIYGQGDLDGEDFDTTDIGITYSVYFK